MGRGREPQPAARSGVEPQMGENSRNTMVGLFVILGLACLAALIVMYSSVPGLVSTSKRYVLNIRFPSADGIRIDNAVMISGQEVGRVRTISFVDPSDYSAGVNVAVSMDARYRVPAGARAITTLPMMGQGRPPIDLVIEDPTAPPLPYGATISGRVRGGFDALIPPTTVATLERTAAQIGEAAEALTPVLRELEQIVKARQPAEVDAAGGPPGNLASAITRLDTLLKDVDEVVGDGDVKRQLREAVANIHAMSETGKVVAANLQSASGEAQVLIAKAGGAVERVDGAVAAVQRDAELIARDVRGVLDQTSTFLDAAIVFGREATSGDGTIAKLLTDGRLYDALVLTFQRLSLAVEDFSALLTEWRKGKIRVGF